MRPIQEIKFSIAPNAFCRSPLFSIDTKIEEAWPTLKKLIRETSADFYQQISNLSADDLDSQPEKVKFTIWKYFNRSRYRSTPFGEFAAISILPIPLSDRNIVISQEMDVLSRADWKAVEQISYQCRQLERASFRTNPLCYAYGKEFHYLYRGEKEFELNAVPQRQDISLLLDFCKELRTFHDIAEIMSIELGMNGKSVLALIRQLLQLQLMGCDLHANVTGEDYFQRRGLDQDTEKLSYKIASRTTIAGGLGHETASELEEYANFIVRCLPGYQNPQLEQFRKSFVQLWEQRSVPLSLALDPLLGIGYGSTASSQQTGLVEELQNRRQAGVGTTIAYNRFEQFMLSGMVKGGDIQLADFAPGPILSALPNTSSMLFHLYRDHPVIQYAGGVTATAILGRFTTLEGVGAIVRQLSGVEQQANSQTIFFDLAYQFEGRTDNVNRREHLYTTELPIGSWSTFQKPLRLEDIMLSVLGDELVLQHVEGSRLMPRLASAYNHGRSDLDLFRFLCDLQYQGLQATLSLDLQVMFPGLEHYPRVYYKKVIACPAKWKLSRCSGIEELKDWFAQRPEIELCSVGQGDQTLVINPKVDEDLTFLLWFQKLHVGELYLTEVLIDKITRVSNERGQKFHAQFIAALTHIGEIYPKLPGHTPENFERDLRLPGSEWFYVELYMRPEVMDEFLLGEIKTLVAQHKALLHEWFFIRYNHPEPHIRLRLKLLVPNLLPTILAGFHQLMDISTQHGHLKRMEIKGYEREIIRYGKNHLDKVERFFHLDSNWALRQLHLSIDDRYAQIITFAEKLVSLLFDDPVQRVSFLHSLAGTFAAEMGFDVKDFKKINQAYQNQSAASKTNSQLLKQFMKLLSGYDPEKKATLLADLIHMHINRRFSSSPRMHEAVIYQFLYKRSLQKKHRK
jgi:thiopeptide-type bacteriocin biosynthesis protein